MENEEEVIKILSEYLESGVYKFNQNNILMYKDRPINELIQKMINFNKKKQDKLNKKIAEVNLSESRLSHLLMSDIIKKYDAKDGKGNYVRDISKLDEILKENKENFFEKYIEKEKENSFNQGVINQLQKDMMLYEQIGYLKGKHKIARDPFLMTDYEV